jgi:secreted trypsin-like serine protease
VPVPPVGLQELDTSLVAASRCAKGNIDKKTDLCVNNPDRNKGACNGDSGGPAVVKVAGAWRLIGAASRIGNARCGAGPTVYTNVLAFKDWIAKFTGA